MNSQILESVRCTWPDFLKPLFLTLFLSENRMRFYFLEYGSEPGQMVHTFFPACCSRTAEKHVLTPNYCRLWTKSSQIAQVPSVSLTRALVLQTTMGKILLIILKYLILKKSIFNSILCPESYREGLRCFANFY